MKFPITLLAALALTGCMGTAGNPGGQPYADQPGGVVAVKPQPAAAVTYDPNFAAASNDIQTRQPALNPLPAPLPVYRPPTR